MSFKYFDSIKKGSEAGGRGEDECTPLKRYAIKNLI